jgi:hypothetical protein
LVDANKDTKKAAEKYEKRVLYLALCTLIYHPSFRTTACKKIYLSSIFKHFQDLPEKGGGGVQKTEVFWTQSQRINCNM